MKFFNLKALMAFLIAGMFIFTACNETTTDPVAEKPEAPKDIMATSLNSTSIKVKWTASTSESNSLWASYQLTYTDGTTPVTKTILKDSVPYTITGLVEGTVYTITVKAKYTNGELSDGITVTWSPASRFTNDAFDDPIQVYEYDSKIGSGLELFNGIGPQVRLVDSKDYWDLGLDTRNNGIMFGSATKIAFGTGTPSVCEVSDPFPGTLDNLYGSVALSTLTFSEKLIDLSAQSNSFVIVVRSKSKSSNWNYAKIYVEKGVSGFLQGTAKDRYINLKISYQKIAGVPYAKIK